MTIRTVTCYAMLLVPLSASNLFGKVPKNANSKLDETLKLYFAADASYRPGDLITRSQLEEFQVYLRTTQGSMLATKPRWLHKTLRDGAPLVNLFHRGGQSVLRQSALKLGGYAELDLLSRTGEGRKLIQEAIKTDSPELLVRWVSEKRKSTASKHARGKDPSNKRAASHRIYTAGDYLEAVLVRSQPLPNQVPAKSKE